VKKQRIFIAIFLLMIGFIIYAGITAQEVLNHSDSNGVNLLIYKIR